MKRQPSLHRPADVVIVARSTAGEASFSDAVDPSAFPGGAGTAFFKISRTGVTQHWEFGTWFRPEQWWHGSVATASEPSELRKAVIFAPSRQRQVSPPDSESLGVVGSAASAKFGNGRFGLRTRRRNISIWQVVSEMAGRFAKGAAVGGDSGGVRRSGSDRTGAPLAELWDFHEGAQISMPVLQA
eukprot:CAMPEP_0117658806 /NCGR_PEP_ID=MMETSP0804-20121206/6068_1 /TAXON_ID=1074897 /ORGANISM="Tetraselmis astigmatica, Strain CCMP880" /LENGTH=184 /DNA_ID=CAMNT_0005465367 /DNA_START=321 /DNA_END=876 /DNA_ORIENTATION=+